MAPGGLVLVTATGARHPDAWVSAQNERSAAAAGADFQAKRISGVRQYEASRKAKKPAGELPDLFTV